MFDVDETLILHVDGAKHKNEFTVTDPDTGTKHRVVPHKRHIDYLKKSMGRGRFVVVWSANGYAWADAVIKKLGLELYVNQVMTKPTVYFDDVPADKFMQRVYLEQKKDK